MGRKTARDGTRRPKASPRRSRRPRPNCWPAARLPPWQAKRLKAARKALLDVIDFVAGGTKAQPNAVFAGSVPYLMLAGNVVAGWQLARSLLVAQDLLQRDRTKAFMRAKSPPRSSMPSTFW